MQFEWDVAKNLINQQKHGLDFETASLVFDDPNALSVQDRYENNEEDTEIIRIVSARKATRAEKERYEESIW